MPQSAQTRASAKWQSKRGLVCKTYKLPSDIVDAFAEACEDKGVSQSAQLASQMKNFIKRRGIEL
jgi:hypothetical protein